MSPDVRRLRRRATAWSSLSQTVPLYPLYALLFADAGVSSAQLSILFALWSLVSVVTDVPTGALADHFSRRLALAGGSMLQALGFGAWLLAPGMAGFALGFVVWGVGGSLASGALEALLYDALDALGDAARFADIQGRVSAAALAAQVPAAGLGTALYAAGGYELVGWTSVAGCVLSAVTVFVLPEASRSEPDMDDQGGYVATLRAGIREAALSGTVRRAVLAVSAVAGLDALEEYLPVLARNATVPTALVPLVILVVPLAGAVGAAAAGAASRWRRARLAAALSAAFLVMGASTLGRHPSGLLGLALGYGLYRLVLVIVETRLQERIATSSRATVSSVAALGTELTALVVFAGWAFGGIAPIALLGVAAGIGLLRWL